MKAENYRFILNEIEQADTEKLNHYAKVVESIMRASMECADYFSAKAANELDIERKTAWVELLENELKDIQEFKEIYRRLSHAAKVNELRTKIHAQLEQVIDAINHLRFPK